MSLCRREAGMNRRPVDSFEGSGVGSICECRLEFAGIWNRPDEARCSVGWAGRSARRGELSEQDRAAAPAAVSLLFASTPVTSTRAVQLADSLAHTPLFSPHPLHRAAPLHSSPAPANPPPSHSNSAAFWPTRHTNSFIPAQPGCSAPALLSPCRTPPHCAFLWITLPSPPYAPA